MSIRLFHRGGRVVLRLPGSDTEHHAWCAVHLRPVEWRGVFRPALALLGFSAETADGALRFGDGSLRWTTGPFWTTIRLQLPPCSRKKGALLASGLLKAARYRDAAADLQHVRARSA